jgi:hypothetical protein
MGDTNRIAMITSVSSNIAELATLTMPNKLEYCLKHDYTLIIQNQKYEDAVDRTHALIHLFDEYDLVWALDADAIITNMNVPIHTLECLGNNITVCEEGMVYWNRINCGSIVMKNTLETKTLLQLISVTKDQWKPLPASWQSWLGINAEIFSNMLTIAPIGSFNSIEWNLPASSAIWGPPGNHWKSGHLVYHPCSIYPKEERLNYIKDALANKVIR